VSNQFHFHGKGLAQFVIETRKLLGLTQGELAEVMGVSQASVISKWESGSWGMWRKHREMLGALRNEHRRRKGDLFLYPMMLRYTERLRVNL
jgi:transcriptional regulator with XRE-family HTH domain